MKTIFLSLLLIIALSCNESNNHIHDYDDYYFLDSSSRDKYAKFIVDCYSSPLPDDDLLILTNSVEESAETAFLKCIYLCDCQIKQFVNSTSLVLHN